MSEITSWLRDIPEEIEARSRCGTLTNADREVLEGLSHQNVISQATAGLESVANYLYVAGDAKHDIRGDLNNVSWLIRLLSDIIDH